jgi:putative lipase involved disintegration of autophagic bodies
MKKKLLYILFLCFINQLQAQSVSFSYDKSGNRIKRGSVAVEEISKTEAIQNEAFAAVLQGQPEVMSAESSEGKIQVFPNPVSDALQVQVPSTMSGEMLSLYDTNGRLMHSLQSNGSTQSIDVGHFPTGTYLLVVGNKGTWRIVKQ